MVVVVLRYVRSYDMAVARNYMGDGQVVVVVAKREELEVDVGGDFVVWTTQTTTQLAGWSCGWCSPSLVHLSSSALPASANPDRAEIS